VLKFGVYIPNFKDFGTPESIIELGVLAEKAGWDGIFLWDHLHWDKQPWPVMDPWVAMAALAQATSTIRFGPMVTPVGRRRPWKLARETVTLDRLSHGRLIFGAGLGWNLQGEFAAFGDEADKRVLGEMLDEGLSILDGLWSGEEFSFSGQHYHVDPIQFLPTPVQRPRVPVWVGGTWPNSRPFRRAARWDGVFAGHPDGRGFEPADIRDMRDFITPLRADGTTGDIVIMGRSKPEQAYSTQFEAFEAGGLTWWLEDLRPERNLSMDHMREIVAAGPIRT
jgi:alkanesulfonate monooxygenase SsuD/methylene tetrahydromethanopterin reductase-like flavin-dependent oxidoreductase (luciferase family)